MPDGGHDRRGSGETMTKRGRRNPSPAFKAKAASAAVKNEKTVAELARQFDVRGNRLRPFGKLRIKAPLPKGLPVVSGPRPRPASLATVDVRRSLRRSVR